jgi:hypothetical protein
VNHSQIAAFARLASINTPPVRVIEGEKTLISRTMHGLAYDSFHDEIIVSSPLAQAILIFRGAAHGEEAPIRVIQGPHTQIKGTDYDGNDKISIDELHGEIYLPIDRSKILVFSREANGDTPPIRVLGGPDTTIRSPAIGHSPVAVDGVHNVMVVRSSGDRGSKELPSLLIFDRMANGNVKPKGVIQGPKTGLGQGGPLHQLIVYAKNGWIIDGSSGQSLGVWSINDSGDVPPHWRLPVKQLAGIEGASGIVLDPAHKELLVTSGGKNRLLAFYFPEIFE